VHSNESNFFRVLFLQNKWILRSVKFLSRRQVALLSLFWPVRALAFGSNSRFQPAMLKHKGAFDKRVSGLRRLAYELGHRTSVEVNLEVDTVSLTDKKLFETPMLCMCGDGAFPPFTQEETENLRRYLTYGGMLFADASDASDGFGFDTSFRREMAAVFPKNPLLALPAKHVLYKTFFLLDTVPGRVLNKPQIEAITLQKRCAVIYSQNDILGALSRDPSGSFEFETSPGGSRQREMATRLAVNIAMYSLCLDYKDDAVHLPLIMNRRR
jgi:hypothetical protein